MKLYQMVIKDVLRRKRRVAYAALGVVVSVMTVVGILTVAHAAQARIYNQLEKYGPNLIVMPAISNLDLRLGDLMLATLTIGENYIPVEKLRHIRQITDDEIRRGLGINNEGNIATIAPKLYTNTKVNGMPVMVVGIEPQEESKIKPWWRVRDGDYLNAPDQALVGAMAAELLKLEVGDMIMLTDGNDVAVTGILEETGSNDDYLIFIPIQRAQQAFGKQGMVSSVDIRALCNACPVETITDRINQNIPGVRAVAVKQVAEGEMGMMEKLSKFMLALAGITLVVGLFGVLNTMISSVHERVKDIGIMRAVGASHGQIIKIFIYEAIIIGILGGIVGYIAGTLLAYIIGPLIFEGIVIAYVPQYLLISLMVAVLVAVVAAVYPAFRATQVKVADSFRAL